MTGSIVNVTLPLVTLSLGAVTVEGFWHAQANVLSRRWTVARPAVVPWQIDHGHEMAWWPVLPGKEN
jgi:hypothetical protein